MREREKHARSRRLEGGMYVGRVEDINEGENILSRKEGKKEVTPQEEGRRELRKDRRTK